LAKVLGSQARETRCGDTSPFWQSPYIFVKNAVLRNRPGSASTRRFFERAARIRDAKLIEDGSVPEELRQRLAIGAVGYRHGYSIAPTQHSAVVPSERAGVGSDQIVERQASLIVLRENTSRAREHCEPDDKGSLRHDPITRAARLTALSAGSFATIAAACTDS
jgi:hypothetical protein